MQIIGSKLTIRGLYLNIKWHFEWSTLLLMLVEGTEQTIHSKH